MTDTEKFEGFKKKMIENNDKYGQEIRSKYGDEKIEKSNAKGCDLLLHTTVDI